MGVPVGRLDFKNAWESAAGTWLYDFSAGWSNISANDPEQILAWGPNLVWENAALGTWVYDQAGNWTQITAANPTVIEVLGADLLWSYPGGTWVWSGGGGGTGWTNITNAVAVTNAGITTIAGAVSGTEMQVDVVAALPAGTNAIGKLAANDGVDIGDVGIQAGTAYMGKVLPMDRDVTLHSNYAKKYYTNAGAVTDGIIWSPAGGTRWHVMSLFIQVSAAATVTLEDDKAGGDEVIWKAELAANSGVFQVFPNGYPLASGEDAADLLITTSAGNVYVTVTGYEI